jgi:hypothetical protein
MVRHIFWDCHFARHSWSWFEDHHLLLLRGKVHRRATLFDDGHTLVHDAFSRLCHCSRIVVPFVLCKPRCKFMFKHETSSLSTFSSVWKDEVHHQLLAKGVLLIKDAQS